MCNVEKLYLKKDFNATDQVCLLSLMVHLRWFFFFIPRILKSLRFKLLFPIKVRKFKECHFCRLKERGHLRNEAMNKKTKFAFRTEISVKY